MGGLNAAQRASRKRTRDNGEYSSPSLAVNHTPFGEFDELLESETDKFVACDDFCQPCAGGGDNEDTNTESDEYCLMDETELASERVKRVWVQILKWQNDFHVTTKDKQWIGFGNSKRTDQRKAKVYSDTACLARQQNLPKITQFYSPRVIEPLPGIDFTNEQINNEAGSDVDDYLARK
jgi:hypothetical protein